MQDQRTLNWNQFLLARITINCLGFFANVLTLIAVIKLRKVILLSGVYSILFCSLRLLIKSPQITRKIRSELLITNRLLADYIFRSPFASVKRVFTRDLTILRDRSQSCGLLAQKMIDWSGEKTDLDVIQLRFLFSGEITRFRLIEFFLFFFNKSLKRANDLNLRSDWVSVSWELFSVFCSISSCCLLNFFLICFNIQKWDNFNHKYWNYIILKEFTIRRFRWSVKWT